MVLFILIWYYYYNFLLPILMNVVCSCQVLVSVQYSISMIEKQYAKLKENPFQNLNAATHNSHNPVNLIIYFWTRWFGNLIDAVAIQVFSCLDNVTQQFSFYIIKLLNTRRLTQLLTFNQYYCWHTGIGASSLFLAISEYCHCAISLLLIAVNWNAERLWSLKGL